MDPSVGGTSESAASESEDEISVVSKLFAQQNLHSVPPALLRHVSSEVREESLYDVHGVLRPTEESSQFIEDKVTGVLFELGVMYQMGEQSVLAYQKAMQDSPESVRRQLLSCLRADRFDVEKAAARVVKHYKMKLDYFGPDGLGRDLTVVDLDDYSREVLIKGGFQVLKKRDRSGRAILVQFPEVVYNCPPQILGKLIFWCGTIAALDEETQRRGIVFIFYSITTHGIEKDPSKRTPYILASFPCLPARVVSVHLCSADLAFITTTASGATQLFESELLCRYVTHYGETTECRNNLMTFGVPPDSLPVRDDGSIDSKHVQHIWWSAQVKTGTMHGFGRGVPSRLASGGSRTGDPITQPDPSDVILGRGLRGKKYTGNLFLKRVLEGRRHEYDSAGRGRKPEIVKEVYSEMCRTGCRFLSPATDDERNATIRLSEWVEASEKEALDRIGHGFRNLRLATKR